MKQINDRFAFDYLFRRFLKRGVDKTQVLNYILNKYSISALVFQERIENRYYRKIKTQEKISKDLLQFEDEVFRVQFLTKFNKLLEQQQTE